MKNNLCKLMVLFSLSAFVMPSVYKAHAAQGRKLSDFSVGAPPNKHNLSSYNTNAKYRAADVVEGDRRGTQICIFCHTPHNANIEGQAPLWSRKFSDETAFQRYSSQTLMIRGIAAAQYASGAQPNGSSKLCLSCHDGISKLGVLKSGAGPEIVLAGGETVITGIASFKPDTNKMKSGHHPVSFVYTASVRDSINASAKNSYQLSTLPLYVKVDKQSRMQCTTCHDPHQNQSDDTQCYDFPLENLGTCNATYTRKVTPFWVYGINDNAGTDQEAVCLSCHPLDAEVGYVRPW